MIFKSLNDIAEVDVRALISNGVGEGRTIEYKSELPGNSDGDKKEFLADASSFANTEGGDLIFGLEEAQGVPTKITGVQSRDLDLEIQRLDSILASGLSPRIRYTTRVITFASREQILIIRMERSWTKPHRVIFKGDDRFYGRNSAGKYALDVNELRAAFTFSSSVTERIRAFRIDRIITLSNNQTPIPFVNDPKIVLHVFPTEAFAGQPQYEVASFYENPRRNLLRPMGSPRWDWRRRLNLEGIVVFSGSQPSNSYTQLYRNGVIEAVRGNLLARPHDGNLLIPSIAYEKQVFDFLPSCFEILKEIGAAVPIVVSVTLTNTRGLFMWADSETGYSIDAETLILPETVVQDFSTPPGKILKPMFDIVWNACGFPQSPNFDVEGKWIARSLTWTG